VQFNKNMKTKNTLYLLAVSAAALSLSATTGIGQVFNSAEALKNSAVANSPRAIEAFPWLAVKSAPSPKASASRTAVAEVSRNRAFASSPRVLEQFPELRFPAQVSERAVVWPVIKNRAYASSPRAQEEFPWLARGSFKVTEQPFEIAPLK
jgi:hypothetical protein